MQGISRQETLFCCDLKNESVDRMSEALTRSLQASDFSSKEIVRMRITVEAVMAIWAENLGKDTSCELIRVQRFGHTSFLLRADGKAVNPVEYQDDLLLSVSSSPNMAAALGIPVEYHYTGGRNELRLSQPRKRTNAIRWVLIALVAAILFGLILRRFLPEAASWISAQLTVPLMDTMTNALRLIAGPLIFLSIFSGITELGDSSTFQDIGITLARRFALMTLLCAVFLWGSVSWLFPVSLNAEENLGTAFSSVRDMVLDIISDDIVSPFQTGNAMQIIFLAVCCGVFCIFMGPAVKDLVRIGNQANSLTMRIMTGLTGLMPVYIFLSISSLILTSETAELYATIRPVLLVTVVSLLLPVVYGAYASLKTKVPFGKLLRSQLPTYLMALTTASSTAAFQSNVESCENELHIDSKLARIGVAFGQVTFKPGSLISLIFLSLFMAEQHDIPITPGFVLMMVITAAILAVATPPIPGGGIASTTIIFTQLGIPLTMMAVCAVILTFADYTITACNVACLQQELLVSAKKLKMRKEK